MKPLVILSLLCTVPALGACTTGELAAGAVAGTAGYIIGKEAEKDD